MATVDVKDVAAKLKSVATYSKNLAQVFHNHALIAPKTPTNFEGSINIIDATVTTINELVELLTDEATEKPIVNDEGLKYVELLGKECATEVARIELAVVKASVIDPQSRRARRNYSKVLLKNSDYVSTAQTEIVAKKPADDFLVAVENTKWHLIENDLESCIERLYELQLHILLVFLVLTVGFLSKKVSTGKVNIATIVSFHGRIKRTSDLVGIKRQRGPTNASGSDSSANDSDYDSDISYRSRPRRRYSSPPPLSPQTFPPPGPIPMMNCVAPVTPSLVDLNMPPSYVETHKPEIITPQNVSIIENSEALPQQGQATSDSTPNYPDEKSTTTKVDEPNEEESEAPKSTVPNGRLLTTKSTGFGLKLKNLFRSKASLAAEMQRVLSDANSTLTAFIIQNSELRQVPHSAFHSLEVTHMRTLLSQINDNTWYKTFSDLRDDEHETLDRITNHRCCGKTFTRDVVALKVLQKNSFNAWMRLLTEKIVEDWIHPHHENNRVILAIVCEKLKDELPAPQPKKYRPGIPGPGFGYMCPPGPPAPPGPPGPPGLSPCGQPLRGPIATPPMPPIRPKTTAGIKSIRPPPLPTYRRQNGVSDLLDAQIPLPPVPAFSTRFIPVCSGTYPTEAELSNMTDHDAEMAMTTYNEYTFRPAFQSMDGSIPGNWNRVTITQESNDRDAVLQKVQDFKVQYISIVTAKLRVTQPQDGQISRLMDELKSGERDSRFEWSWVSLTLHSDNAELPQVPGTSSAITRIHVIAQRTPRPEYKPKELYRALFDNPRPYALPGQPPMLGPTGFGPPGPPPPPPPGNRIVVRSYPSSDESDSSVGGVRRRLMRRRKNKVRRQARSRDSDSSDSEAEERTQKDIRIKMTLKRGDDVVEKLLGLWTVK